MLSTDHVISTSDIAWRNGTFSAAKGEFRLLTPTFTLPNLPGTYFVGIIVDPTNTRSEDDPANNATELGLTLKIRSGC